MIYYYYYYYYYLSNILDLHVCATCFIKSKNSRATLSNF